MAKKRAMPEGRRRDESKACKRGDKMVVNTSREAAIKRLGGRRMRRGLGGKGRYACRGGEKRSK